MPLSTEKTVSLTRSFFVAALAGLGILCHPGVSWSKTPNAVLPGVNLLSCDRNGAVIELDLPQVLVTPIEEQGRSFDEISIAGWGYNMEEGHPRLPLGGLFLALPPGALTTLSVEILESHAILLENPLKANPAFQNELDPQIPKGTSPTDTGHYAASLPPYSQDWVSLDEPVWLRNFYAAPLRIRPIHYYRARGKALVAGKMRIHVAFHGGRQGRFIADPFGEAMLRGSILNYNQARGWQEKSGGPPPQVSQSYGKYKVLVERDGIYKIGYDDLTAAGIDPLQIDPQTLKLSVKLEQGAQDTLAQIPIWVAGQAELDGEFDPDDYILFFGKAPRGTFTYNYLYSSQNVYWLDWDGAPGSRLASRSVTPGGSALQALKFKASTRTELDTMYDKFGIAPETDDVDHWMWLRLDSNINPQYSALLSLPEHEPPPEGSAYNHYDVTVSLRGYTYGLEDTTDHRAYGFWNSTSSDPIFDVLFEDQDDVIASGQISAASISTFNELILQAPEVPEFFANAFYLDWIKIDYWRNYRVLNDTLLFQKPQNLAPQNILYTLTGLSSDSLELWDISSGARLTGYSREQDTLKFRDFSIDTTYYYAAGSTGWMTPTIEAETPSEWKSPLNGADCIMLTHEDFYDALDPLVDLYTSRGMRVIRAKAGDIYDEYNFGMKDPQSLFDFLQYAFFNYQDPPPTFALLVGDASWDYKNLDHLPYQDFMPTHHHMTWKWGETASDNWLVAVSGTDPLPDYAVGRLPANNEAEIEVLVQKSLQYAAAPPGYWSSRTIFTNGALDLNIDAPWFDSTVVALLDQYFPDWYDPARIYSLPSEGNEEFYGTSADLIAAWNQGAAYVNYMGHAGNQTWVTLNLPEIAQLDNGSELPFAASFSCFTGVFSNTNSFGEAMILKPDGGAVAFWSNCGIAYIGSNTEVNDNLFTALFENDVPTIGQATTQAKWLYYAEYGDFNSVVTDLVLLGDPGSYFVFSDPDPRDTLDNTPPEIAITVGDSLPFANDDFLTNPVRINFDIYDSTGVAVYSITLHEFQTAGQGNLLDTTYYMPQDSMAPEITLSINPPDSFGQHVLVSFADSLTSGDWQFTISATDSFDQGPTVATMTFKISGGELEFIGTPLNYPNPFAEQTAFAFELTEPADVTIKIFTVSGKLIQVIQTNADAGYTIVEWDGRDAEGDPVSNGAYLYKVIARNGDRQVEKIEKLARIR